MLTDAVVPVLTGGGYDRDVAVAQLGQRLLKVRGVLSEPAGAVGGGHEEGCLVRIETRGPADLQEVPQGDLVREAFLAAGVEPAQLEGFGVGVGGDGGVDADRPERCRHQPGTGVGHLGDVEGSAGEAGRSGPGLGSAFGSVCDCRHHRNIPLLSR